MTCYTFQEATWGDWFAGNDITIGKGSQVGTAKLEVRETRKDDFFDGRVILLFDNAATPALMFMGKVTHKTQVGNLYNVELTELKIELTTKKPTKTFTAQSVELMAEYLATLTNFVWDNGNITSPGGGADSWSISYKGGVSIAEMLDEISKWVAYIWYCKGDLELVIDGGVTASGKTIGTGGETLYGVPEIENDALLIATKVIVKGRVEANGPVIARYPPDTALDVQTRTGEIVARINRPNWDYDQCLAYATQVYNERSTWTDKVMIPIPLDDTLRPGMTLECVSVPDVTDGTYLITQVRHIDGVTEVILDNAGISFEQLTQEQEYERASLEDEWTPQDAAESAAGSTIIEKDSLDNVCAGILTKRVSEAQGLTLIYDSTHKCVGWIDSTGSFNLKATYKVQVKQATAMFVVEATSGNASLEILASGGVGTEDAWLYVNGKDDSAILFQENNVTKGYVKWDKGDADLNIHSDGDIVLDSTGVVKLGGNLDPNGHGWTLPFCKAYEDGFTLGNAAWTEITLGHEDANCDLLGWHSTSSNQQRITVDRAGWYFVTAWTMWDNSTTGLRGLVIYKNAAKIDNYHETVDIAGYAYASWAVHGCFLLAANDIISIGAYQSTGGNLTVQAALTVVRLATGGDSV